LCQEGARKTQESELLQAKTALFQHQPWARRSQDQGEGFTNLYSP